MPHVLIPLEDGRYRIFSTVVDDFLHDEPLTEEEVVAYNRELGADESERHSRWYIQQLKDGVYQPFMTMKDARKAIARREQAEREAQERGK